MVLTWESNLNWTLLAWGTLSTQGIVILSGVVCCCWRRWRWRRWRWRRWRHKSCPHPKFENRRRYRLTFFLIDWYEWEGVQSKKKIALRVRIALGRHVFAFWRHKSCPHPKFKKRNRYWPNSFFNRLVRRRRCAVPKKSWRSAWK